MTTKRKRKYTRLDGPPRYPCEGCYGRVACDEMDGVCWSWWEWFCWRWPKVCKPFRAVMKGRMKK